MIDKPHGHVFYGVTTLRQTGLLGQLDTLGVPRPDIEKLMGPSLWLSQERHPMRRALDACMFGSLDMLGIQRFTFSAEWIATWIAIMVHPANHLIACAWYHGSVSADAVLQDPASIPMAEGLDAGQLFALVQEAYQALHERHSDLVAQLQEAVESGQLDIVEDALGTKS